MNNRIRVTTVLLLVFLLFTVSFALAEGMTPYENLIFESAGVSIGTSMDADFNASTNRTCTSIYVSSCTLERQNANNSWSFSKYLTPPSFVATNTSDFGTTKYYSSDCVSGYTYRIKATFKAVYNGKIYTVYRTSNGVAY